MQEPLLKRRLSFLLLLGLPTQELILLGVNTAAQDKFQEDLLGHEARLAVLLEARLERRDELLHGNSVGSRGQGFDDLLDRRRVDVLRRVDRLCFLLVGRAGARRASSGALVGGGTGFALLGWSGTTGSRPDRAALRSWTKGPALLLLSACAVGHLASRAFTIASRTGTSTSTCHGSVATTSGRRSAWSGLLLFAGRLGSAGI